MNTITINHTNIFADLIFIAANLGFLYNILKYPFKTDPFKANIIVPMLLCYGTLICFKRLNFNINNFGNVFDLSDLTNMYKNYNYF